MTFLEELEFRGLLQDSTPGLEKLLSGEKVKGYIGYDPTAPSITIGNLVTVMMLVHFQRHGHQPVVLFGGATGRVGDPSGKDAERKMLDEEVIERNLQAQKEQFHHLLRFGEEENKAILCNNYDWFKSMGFLEFLRDAGKHLTVNYMMSKESVKRRIETGISFTEFSYQLLQGYDFYHLNKNEDVKLQMGGSDQWGNITTGTELIRRKSDGDAYAVTCPLLTKADGTKFGKSEGQNIWLDRKLTSPYKFYQFFLNATDEDAARFLRIFCLRPIMEIKQILADHEERKGAKVAQHVLAEDLTAFVHSEEDVQKSKDISRILFGKATSEELSKMTKDEMLEAFDGLPVFKLDKSLLADGTEIVELMATHTDISKSKGDARRSLKGNAISLNKSKVNQQDRMVTITDLVNESFLLLQNGKKNHHLVIFE